MYIAFFILVWITSGLEVYMLVDFSLFLQKQQTALVEDSSYTRRMDIVAVKEIYSAMIPSHSSFLVKYFVASILDYSSSFIQFTYTVVLLNFLTVLATSMSLPIHSTLCGVNHDNVHGVLNSKPQTHNLHVYKWYNMYQPTCSL